MGAGGWAKYRIMFRILKITGDSMYPRYQHGDFVLIRKTPISFTNYHRGDVIVFEHALYGTLIKKIDQIDGENKKVFVIAEHEDGLDSRQLGWIDMKCIIGKVIHDIRSKPSV